MRFLKLIAFCFLLLPSVTTLADDYPEKPNPPRLVNDFAGMLARGEADALENKLVAYDDSTSTQISVVIVQSLNGMERAQYATELAEKWGIGRKQKDNGVLLLISKGDRQIFIATGRGVEQYLPDVACGQIIRNIITPNFKAGNYYHGIDAATDNMIARLQGTFTNEDQDNDTGNNAPIPAWVVILIIGILVLLSFIFRNRGGGGTTFSSGVPPIFWGGGFGGGGGSSSGGGGFGGFGGGSFGGGGAGGSW